MLRLRDQSSPQLVVQAIQLPEPRTVEASVIQIVTLRIVTYFLTMWCLLATDATDTEAATILLLN